MRKESTSDGEEGGGVGGCFSELGESVIIRRGVISVDRKDEGYMP